MDIKEVTKQIDGLISDKECEILYKLARKSKFAIVEIGSFKGKSTVCLAKGAQDGYKVKVYAIDPHNGMGEWSAQFGDTSTFKDFKDNVKKAGVDDLIVPLVKTSVEAVADISEPIGLIFIDGGHEYKFVKQDLDLWFTKVKEHGIISFHDTICWQGPRKVVRDLAYRSKNIKNSGVIDSIWFGEKVSQNTWVDRVRNRYVIFLSDIYRISLNFNIPIMIRRIGKKFLRSIQ